MSDFDYDNFKYIDQITRDNMVLVMAASILYNQANFNGLVVDQMVIKSDYDNNEHDQRTVSILQKEIAGCEMAIQFLLEISR